MDWIRPKWTKYNKADSDRQINQIETLIRNSQRKILPNLKITYTQQLELKTQIKINQNNNNRDPLTKIDTQIRINKEKLRQLSFNKHLKTLKRC